MPNGYINLIHYDDAARVVVAALLSPKSVRREGKLYLVSDGTPITRKDICLATIQCPGLVTNSIISVGFYVNQGSGYFSGGFLQTYNQGLRWLNVLGILRLA